MGTDAVCCVQVASLDMLARVYVEHDKWEEAAAVYNALASRTSNYNEPSVNLNTRLDLFRMAKLQVTGLHHPPDYIVVTLSTFSSLGCKNVYIYTKTSVLQCNP